MVPKRIHHAPADRLGPRMAIHGSASAEIDAPIEEVFEVAADVEGSPRWQPEIKVAEARERDAEGRQVLVRTETDAKGRSVSRNCGRDDHTSKCLAAPDLPALNPWLQAAQTLKLSAFVGGGPQPLSKRRCDPCCLSEVLENGSISTVKTDALQQGRIHGRPWMRPC